MKKGMLTRIIVGVILTAVFIAIWYFGGVVQTVLCGIVSLLCVHEMVCVLKKKGHKVYALPMYILGGVLSPMVVYADKKYIFALFFVCMFINILVRICDKEGKNEDMLCSLLVYVYPLATLFVLFEVCNFYNTAYSRFAMLLTFACPLLGDTLAYFFGSFFGKRKLCEHISPKKTVAGGIGSMIGAIGAACGIFFLQNVIMRTFGEMFCVCPLWKLAILGFVLGIAGQVGDLFASCVKRWAGVKDYGNIFPGHGGMMDRIDSVMMAAPFVLMFLVMYN